MNMIQKAKDVRYYMTAFLAMFAVVAFFMPDVLAAAVNANPLETAKNIYIKQAQDNIFPLMIIWIVILGAALAFMMNKWTPLIMAIGAAIIIAIAPEIAPDFTYQYVK